MAVAKPSPIQKTSQRQSEALYHLRVSGGMTMPALGVIYGHAARKLVRKLLQREKIKISETSGIRLYLTAGTPYPKTEESFYRRIALGWLYARVIEAGCEWKNGIIPEVIFRNGDGFRVAWRGKTGRNKGRFLALLSRDARKPRELPPGSLVVYSDDLREKVLREALTRKK